MDIEALKAKLKELHVSLEGSESPDAELVQLLQVLDNDIRALMSKSDAAKADIAGAATRTQVISARFAAQHPHLEPVLRDLTDMLASIGI